MVGLVGEIPIPGDCLADSTGIGVGHSPDSPSEVSSPFLAGPENRLVSNAICSLLPGVPATHSSSYSPLLLWGPSGTGKSHLARGLCELWEGTDPGSAVYFTASEFRQQLVEAIKSNQTADFAATLRSLRLLAIDDIHRWPADDYLNQQLVSTLDSLAESGAVMLVTSRESPGQLFQLSPAISSRLSGGCVLSLSPPGLEARVGLVKRLANRMGQEISAPAAEAIASRVSSTTHDLSGVLVEMVYSPEAPRDLSAAAVTQYLKEREDRQKPTFADVLRVVAKHYAIPQKVIKSSSRRQSVVLARAMVIYLARTLSGLSFERIGRALSGRDHSTIMHSYRKIDDLLKTDMATQEAVADLRRLLSRSN